MSLHPAIMEFGSVRIISPDGSHRVGAAHWPELAAIVLLEPEPALQARWVRRLESHLGVDDAHRRALERATLLSFPGDDVLAVGHKLTDVMTEMDPHLEWFAIRTATRREEAAEKSLIEAGLTVYSPRMIRYDRRRGRRIRIDRPLLPGYLFAGMMSREQLGEVMELEAVHNVVRAIGGEREPMALDFGDIERILQQDHAGEFDRTRRSKRADPEQGDTVRIIGGQFQGFPAEFVQKKADDRVRVLVQLFGRWSELSLKADDLAEMRDEEV